MTTTQPAITLHPTERTRCEIWTRVMGYHRPVSAFNAGKQAEHRARVAFNAAKAGAA
jgi:hypothetical protein